MRWIQTIKQPLECEECKKPIPANEVAVMVTDSFPSDNHDGEDFISELYCQECYAKKGRAA
jgi:hypothetical protein